MVFKKQRDPFSIELMVPCKYNVCIKHLQMQNLMKELEMIMDGLKQMNKMNDFNVVKRKKESMNGLIYRICLKKCTIQFNMVRKFTIGINSSTCNFSCYIYKLYIINTILIK